MKRFSVFCLLGAMLMIYSRTHSQSLTSLPKIFPHEPLIGVTAETNQNGRVQRYSYDPYGRLQSIRDQENNILKLIQYKYSTETTN
ncbi:YD repeat-containing protein [Chitinophaga jiangningensis]|uniref:YD repeat-containing protein n=2 Tax=Chitinophaga jiangningensis TaxID=1419482 RepID=A0A1M6V8F8_9BACT|nr:YD repeat-containing protein [Chitinophaga jiangningensis]